MDLHELETRLLEISFQKEDRELAETAFEKIYREYARDITKMIGSYLCKIGFVDREYLNMVINNTFCTVFEKPLSFTLPNTAKDDKCFKSWLCEIAKNEFYSEIENLKGKDKLIIGTPEFNLPEIEIPTDIIQGANEKLMSAALNTLNERDRSIMKVLFDYYVEGKNTPSNVLEVLCEVHNVKKPHLRKIKERSIEKIVNYIEKHSALKASRHVR